MTNPDVFQYNFLFLFRSHFYENWSLFCLPINLFSHHNICPFVIKIYAKSALNFLYFFSCQTYFLYLKKNYLSHKKRFDILVKMCYYICVIKYKESTYEKR